MGDAERGYFLIEGRWEGMHDLHARVEFFEVEQLGGSLADAKTVAQSYLNRHVASNANGIEWVEGIWNKARCYYGRNAAITFRISR
jgi:hypothetical protein